MQYPESHWGAIQNVVLKNTTKNQNGIVNNVQYPIRRQEKRKKGMIKKGNEQKTNNKRADLSPYISKL